MHVPSATSPLRYCTDFIKPLRRYTREVKIGDVPLGGTHAIRLQSMTTTDTMDVQGTVAQILRLVEAGSTYVRLAVPSQKEAEQLACIKKALVAAGHHVPLIADVHFTPKAAEIAARHVEKIRVNPGNYVDKKRFATLAYSDSSYQVELSRIAERFAPLVEVCKKEGRAMRIGTNHGSLSDRIMSRYGDTPLGMVESALEFVRICEDMCYYDVVLSMKASQPHITLHAYRLLVQRLEEEGLEKYPLHLGVTEAGDGVDGRLKSAVGIGTLLSEGLGDTVRVSLTEAPERELPVAAGLRDGYRVHQVAAPDHVPCVPAPAAFSPFAHVRHKSQRVLDWGGEQPPRVVVDASACQALTQETLHAQLGYHYHTELDKWESSEQAADYVYTGHWGSTLVLPRGLRQVLHHHVWEQCPNVQGRYPLFDVTELESMATVPETVPVFLLARASNLEEIMPLLKTRKQLVLWLQTSAEEGYIGTRQACNILQACRVPTCFVMQVDKNTAAEKLLLQAATELGGCFADGYGDGCCLQATAISIPMLREISFGVLQAARVRISKTEYIACPSCGRTLFDLETTTAHIRARTSHLKGLKIGIMGCIVNGPGEMADADYGYVGSGKDSITLYRGKVVTQRNIPTTQAVDRLISLIKADGKWQDPPNPVT